MRPLAVIFAALLLLRTAPLAAQIPEHALNHVCDAAAAKAERDWNVPPGVLSAVGTVESGRAAGPIGTPPWPWTINAAGQGRYFATKEEAVAGVVTHMERGFPYIDVGCFQIDLAYHPGVFRSLDEAFDPDRNAQAAAQILSAERARAPDWSTAVARYHSATPGLGMPYLQRVRAALPAAKLRAITAEFAATTRTDPPYVTRLPPAMSTPTLPTVIYPSPLNTRVREPQVVHIGPAGQLPQIVGFDQKAVLARR